MALGFPARVGQLAAWPSTALLIPLFLLLVTGAWGTDAVSF
jgi:hypothetical protein